MVLLTRLCSHSARKLSEQEEFEVRVGSDREVVRKQLHHLRFMSRCDDGFPDYYDIKGIEGKRRGGGDEAVFFYVMKNREGFDGREDGRVPLWASEFLGLVKVFEVHGFVLEDLKGNVGFRRTNKLGDLCVARFYDRYWRPG